VPLLVRDHVADIGHRLTAWQIGIVHVHDRAPAFGPQIRSISRSVAR
jgi:hypothetical protein